VKTERANNNRAAYRAMGWIFGERRHELRPALGIAAFKATVDTARHRLFQFMPAETVCDDKVVLIASDDPLPPWFTFVAHSLWALGQRTRLGQGDDRVYVKVRCSHDVENQGTRSISCIGASFVLRPCVGVDQSRNASG
jgi:hypothetical protein